MEYSVYESFNNSIDKREKQNRGCNDLMNAYYNFYNKVPTSTKLKEFVDMLDSHLFKDELLVRKYRKSYNYMKRNGAKPYIELWKYEYLGLEE